MNGYFNGQYLPEEKIRISPEDRGFLFADGLYEVIRSYGGNLFHAESHIDRMSYGASVLRFNTFDFEYLIGVAENLCRQNELNRSDSIVYIQVTRGTASRIHHFPPSDTELNVYANVVPFVPRKYEQDHGVRVITVPDQRWSRCDIKTIGLLANVLAAQHAKESGVSEAIFIRDGFVMEGSHSSVAAVLDGRVIIPPKTNYILGSITRQVVLELCTRLAIPALEQSIPESEFTRSDEVMVLSTTYEVTPVVEIDGQKVGSGRPGPMSKKLQEAFLKYRGQLNCM